MQRSTAQHWAKQKEEEEDMSKQSQDHDGQTYRDRWPALVGVVDSRLTTRVPAWD